MFFNSFTFILFFILVLVVSRRILSWTSRKAFLLVTSYLFYAAWNPPFVILLWLSTVADWYLARWMGAEENPARRKAYLFLSLALNLGLLGFFKYGNFLLSNLEAVLRFSGVAFEPREMNIILPVGISFYTFQTLSYTFDVYRKKIKPWPSSLDYALYVTFFPHLVAGPILRSGNFLVQCKIPRKGSAAQIGWGILLLITGLFTKMVIADALMADIADKVYDAAANPNFFEAWIGTLAFAIQIFCDFAGYSTCAIGIALTLGFIFPENFRSPYAAVGFSDFWRRWHISFSTWLRDYLYISLGGNRKGTVRTCANLMTTMLLGGLWHGASWMFVFWGGLHGLYLVIERALKPFALAQHPIWNRWPGQIFLRLLTFLGVCLTWVFFRAEAMDQARHILSAMLTPRVFSKPWGVLEPGLCLYILGIILAVLAFQNVFRDRTFRGWFEKIPWWWQGTLVGLMLFGILISMGGEDRAFIYFQF